MDFHNICSEFTESLKLLSVAHPFSLHDVFEETGFFPPHSVCLGHGFMYCRLDFAVQSVQFNYQLTLLSINSTRN